MNATKCDNHNPKCIHILNCLYPTRRDPRSTQYTNLITIYNESLFVYKYKLNISMAYFNFR